MRKKITSEYLRSHFHLSEGAIASFESSITKCIYDSKKRVYDIVLAGSMKYNECTPIDFLNLLEYLSKPLERIDSSEQETIDNGAES